MSIDMEWLSIVSFAMAIAFAAFIHGTFGFGFPLVVTPLLTFLFDLKTAILITLVPTIVNNIINIRNEGSPLPTLRRFWLLIIFAIAGSYVGTLLLLEVRSEPFKILLGLMVLAYVYLATGKRIDFGNRFRENLPNIAVFGFIGGIVGGTVNVMLPPLLVFFSALRISKSEIIIGLNICFMLGKFTQLWVYGIHDTSFDGGYILVTIIAVLALLPGAYAGIWIRNRIDTERYHKLLYLALLVTGVFLIVQDIPALWSEFLGNPA